LPEIVVVPPLTAVGMQLRGLTLQQLGVQAGAGFMLQGAVLASGARVRVNAQRSPGIHTPRQKHPCEPTP
jgi:TolB-like protein